MQFGFDVGGWAQGLSAASPRLCKASGSGLTLLAWGMRNAMASSHRLLRNRPALRISREALLETGKAMRHPNLPRMMPTCAGDMTVT
jgi:hypothetical protein